MYIYIHILIIILAYPNCMQDLRLVGEYSLGPEGSRWVDGEWFGSQSQPDVSEREGLRWVLCSGRGGSVES